MIHKAAIKSLDVLHTILPPSCNQIAAIFSGGVWEVSYVLPVEPVGELA